ncbi:MAG: hypothetical protein ACLT98_17125 [Eggerthellaceae bacterium]
MMQGLLPPNSSSPPSGHSYQYFTVRIKAGGKPLAPNDSLAMTFKKDGYTMAATKTDGEKGQTQPA